MDNFEIAKMYNIDGLSLKQIGEKLGMSKSTVQRRLTSNGWHFDKSQGKYINTIDFDDKVTLENNKSDKNTKMDNNVSNETLETVIRNYEIPTKMDRALKIKAAIESKKVVDIVRAALDAYVEEKYLKM
jgi:IS30 family transposase